jgi:TRAP-type C4-dicarboxylate transport system permease small subunit
VSQMAKFSSITRNINTVLVFMAGIFLIAMIVLTCANIFSRLFWLPIRGTYELMGFMGAVVASFALGYTQIKRGHIAVNILVNRFSEKTQRILNGVNHTICMAFFALAAWKIFEKAVTIKNTGEVTETLRMMYHPFVYGVAIGCAVLALVFFVDVVNALNPKKDRSLT